MKTIGERIKQARLKLKLSAYDLAIKVGYKTQSGIANLENKATGSGGNKISAIAAALYVSVDWLLNGPDSDDVPFLPQSFSSEELKQANGNSHQANQQVIDFTTNKPLTQATNWPFILVSQERYTALSKEAQGAVQLRFLDAIKEQESIASGVELTKQSAPALTTDANIKAA